MAMQEHEPELPEWTLGDRLRKAREHAGLSREELADILGVKKNSLWNWEADASRPRDLVDLLHKWSKATGVPAQWLLGIGLTSQYQSALPLRLVLGGVPEQLSLRLPLQTSAR